jgi:hypothetical protein
VNCEDTCQGYACNTNGFYSLGGIARAKIKYENKERAITKKT